MCSRKREFPMFTFLILFTRMEAASSGHSLMDCTGAVSSWAFRAASFVSFRCNFLVFAPSSFQMEVNPLVQM